MNIRDTVFDVIEELFGLSKEDLEDCMDQDLWEEHILDSVGSALMIANVEERLKVKIDLDEIGPEDFKTVNSIFATFERIVKK